MMRYPSSDGNSHPNSHSNSPSESEASDAPKVKEHQINAKHLKCLARNGVEFDLALCQNIDKPTLQMLYQRYCTVNNICCQVDKMRKEKSWKGATLTKSEIIKLFVAKTTWHNYYHVQMPSAEKQEDMRAWITGEMDAPSDADIWGGVKDHYTLKDLDKWLEQKVGKKPQVVNKGMGKDIVKGKAKMDVRQEKEQTKSSGAEKQMQVKGSGKGKQKEVGKQKEIVPRVHKKKVTTG
jgi:hypothetical protein